MSRILLLCMIMLFTINAQAQTRSIGTTDRTLMTNLHHHANSENIIGLIGLLGLAGLIRKKILRVEITPREMGS